MLAALVPWSTAAAQHDMTVYAALQDRLFQMVLSQPAEAKPLLDSLMRHQGLVPDTVLAQTSLMLGIYHSVTGQHAESIRHGERAVNLAAGNRVLRARMLRNLGTMYRNANQLPEARLRLSEAMSIHQEYGSCRDLALDLSELASVYRLELRFDSAAACLVRSLALMDADPDMDRRQRAVTLQKLANSYLSMDRYDLALRHLEEAMAGLKAEGDLANYGAAAISLVECRMGLDDLEGAGALLDRLIPELHAFGNPELLFLALGLYAEFHVLQGDSTLGARVYEEAVRLGVEGERPSVLRLANGYLRIMLALDDMDRVRALVEDQRLDALLPLTDLGTRSLYQGAKGMALLALGRKAEGMRFMHLSELAQDSLLAQSTSLATMEIQDRYRADLLTKEKEFTEQRLGLQRRINVFLAIAFALVVALGGYLIYTYRLRSRLKNSELDSARREQELLQERVAAESRLAAIRQDNIDQLKRELMQSGQENTVLRTQVENLVQQLDTGSDLALRDEEGNLTRDRKEWEFLMARFNLAYPSFTKQLLKHYPDLTKGEVEFCALLKLNLSYKEIAGVLNIASDSVAKKKYRIAQKLRVSGAATLEEVVRSVG